MKNILLIIFIAIPMIITGCNNDSDYFVNTEEISSFSQKQIQEKENSSGEDIQSSIIESSTKKETETLLTVEDVLLNYITTLYEEKMYFMAGNQLYAKYIMLMRIDNEEETVCYLMPWCIKFNVKSDGYITKSGANGVVCEIKLKQLDDGGYMVIDYWEPGDGALYSADIKERFPEEIHDTAINSVTLFVKTLNDEICNEVGFTE